MLITTKAGQAILGGPSSTHLGCCCCCCRGCRGTGGAAWCGSSFRVSRRKAFSVSAVRATGAVNSKGPEQLQRGDKATWR